MKICNNCGQQWDDDAAVCGVCGTPLEVSVAAETTQETKKKSGSSKIIITIVIIAAVAFLGLATLIGVGASTNWFGITAGTPKALKKSIQKTFSSKNLTLTVTETYEDAQDSDYDYETTFSARVNINKKDRDFDFILEEDFADDDAYYCMLNGKKVYYKSEYTYDGESYRRAETESISNKEVAAMFSLYEAAILDKEIDWEETLEDLDLDEDLKGETIIDIDEIQELIDTLDKKYVTNKKWMQEYAGYSYKKGVHTFTPDLADFFEELLRIAEDEEILKKSQIKNLEENEIDYDYLSDIEVELTFTVKGKKCIAATMTIVDEDGDTYTYEAKVSNINKSKITEAEIKDFEEEVDEIMEENECPECGEQLYDGYCYDCGYGYNDDYYW